MSKFNYRPRGGQEGIEVKSIEIFETPAGPAVPLPGKNPVVQLEKTNLCDHTQAVYWETETGSHGWCCSDCGIIVQWG